MQKLLQTQRALRLSCRDVKEGINCEIRIRLLESNSKHESSPIHTNPLGGLRVLFIYSIDDFILFYEAH